MPGVAVEWSGEGGADRGFGRGAVRCRRQGLGQDGGQRRGGGEVEHVLEWVGVFIEGAS